MLGDLGQIRDESLQSDFPVRWRPAQNRRRVNRREESVRPGYVEALAPMLGDAKFRSHQALCRRGAEGHDDLGFKHGQLGFEPRTAGRDFPRVWFLVQAAFAGGFPFEMLYRVRDVNFSPIDFRRGERCVEQPAGGADKGPADAVFLIARLLAHENDLCPRRARPENRLRAKPVKRAGLAAFRPGAESREGERCRIVREITRGRGRKCFHAATRDESLGTIPPTAVPGRRQESEAVSPSTHFVRAWGSTARAFLLGEVQTCTV